MVMYDCITDPQAELLRDASLFFIASVHPDLEAGPLGEGPVNLSPKGMMPIHVLGPNKARQVVEIEVDKTQTSCGFGVPIYEFVGERPPEARGRRFRQ